jgi:ectoine hydroxylase-related dioxygenase (phytanoyl-CoA dioxygenase family)
LITDTNKVYNIQMYFLKIAELGMDAITYQDYCEKGYIVVKNIISLDYIYDLYQTVIGVFRKHSFNKTDFSTQEPWTDISFHKAMHQFRSENPQEFGRLFDTVQTCVALWRLGTDPKICETAATLLSDTQHGLSVTDLLFRMDAPHDARNKLAWHQDSTYFRQNDRGENGCVCSVSMMNITLAHGPLEILPGSHTVGRIEVPSSGKESAVTSEQFRVPIDIVERFQPAQVVLNAGDAIFFNFDLIHRSGANISEFFRFTAISRFHRMLTPDFKPGRLVYKNRQINNDETKHSTETLKEE